jgi:hypothetical protein
MDVFDDSLDGFVYLGCFSASFETYPTDTLRAGWHQSKAYQPSGLLVTRTQRAPPRWFFPARGQVADKCHRAHHLYKDESQSSASSIGHFTSVLPSHRLTCSTPPLSSLSPSPRSLTASRSARLPPRLTRRCPSSPARRADHARPSRPRSSSTPTGGALLIHVSYVGLPLN